MTREELSDELRAAEPRIEDVIYIERRGENFAWSYTGLSTDIHQRNAGKAGLPDTWIYYSGPWPLDDEMRWEAFFDDLIGEMESMANGGDRCRWPLGDPWPQRR